MSRASGAAETRLEKFHLHSVGGGRNWHDSWRRSSRRELCAARRAPSASRAVAAAEKSISAGDNRIFTKTTSDAASGWRAARRPARGVPCGNCALSKHAALALPLRSLPLCAAASATGDGRGRRHARRPSERNSSELRDGPFRPRRAPPAESTHSSTSTAAPAAEPVARRATARLIIRRRPSQSCAACRPPAAQVSGAMQSGRRQWRRLKWRRADADDEEQQPATK